MQCERSNVKAQLLVFKNIIQSSMFCNSLLFMYMYFIIHRGACVCTPLYLQMAYIYIHIYHTSGHFSHLFSCLLRSNSASAFYSPSPPSSFKLNTLYKTCRLTFTRLTTTEEMAKSVKVHYWSFDSIILNQSLNHSLAFPELSTTSHGLWQHEWPCISEGHHRQ